MSEYEKIFKENIFNIISATLSILVTMVIAIFYLGGEWKKWEDIKNTHPHESLQNIPRGIIVFFNGEECPDGWKVMNRLSGRYIVGIEENKPEIGLTIGRRLDVEENREVGKHSHEMIDSGFHSHDLYIGENYRRNFSPDGAYNSVYAYENNDDRSRWPASNRSYSHKSVNGGIHKHIVEAYGDVVGTNAPYIHLLPCVKS